MKRFFIIYTIMFSSIWIGSGIYALATNKPSAMNLLIFSLAFTVIMILAVMFSYGLMNYYKKIDRLMKNNIQQKFKGVNMYVHRKF